MGDKNWKQHLKDYHQFMKYDSDSEYDLDIDSMTQEQAKQRLRDDLEYVIGANGYGELYETEKIYIGMLGMELN